MTDLEKPTIPEGEKPTIPEGTTVKAPAATAEVDALVKELEKAGVTTTQELQGKLRASQEAGQLANLLGDANKRIENLEKAAAIPPASDYDYSEQPVDIDTAIEKGINKVLDARETKTRQVQQQAMEIWNGIQTDESYPLVKGVWEIKVKDPNFMIGVQSGKTDVAKEYMETVREYYKGIAKQSLETINQLQGGPIAPHIEGDVQTRPNLPGNETENTTTKKAQEQVNSGKRLTESDEMAVIDEILKG